MGQSLVDFIREALATLSDMWERANDFAAPYWQIFVGAVLLMPVVGIILFAVFFTAAIPVFGILALALIIYFLVLRIYYPLVYTAVALESGRKVMLGILFLIAAECFLLHVLAAIGTFVRGEGLSDFSLSMFVVFGIITILLLSAGITTPDPQRTPKRMVSWAVGLTVTALVLLAFPPVREEFPLFKNAIGEKIAGGMRWFRGTESPTTFSQSGVGMDSAPRFHVSQVAGVSENDVQSSNIASAAIAETTFIGKAGDIFESTFTVSQKNGESIRLESETHPTILWEREDGGVDSIKCGEGIGVWDPNGFSSKDPQTFRVAFRRDGKVRVMKQ